MSAECRCQKCVARAAAKIVEMPNGTKRRRCDACGRGIPPYAAMQGAGFQSASVDHEYMDSDGEHNFFMPVTLELCYPCYVADYAKEYPNAPPPQPVNVADFEDLPAAPPAFVMPDFCTVTYA